MDSSDAIATPQLYYRAAIRATLIGLGVNLSLGIIKLIGGIAGQSFALISDAINSLGDSIASIVTVSALWIAQRPPDAEHPYGHTRVEAIASLIISVFIVASGGFVGWEALHKFREIHPIPPFWTLWIAGANILIKESLFWYNRNVAQRTGSSVIFATAWDHRSDALCSLAVLVGLGLINLRGVWWIWADDAAALLVALAIIWSGGRLLKESISELLDPQADATLINRIRELASGVPGVRAVEKLWARKTGIEYLVDIHVQVDPQMSVAEGHRIGHLVRDILVNRLAPVRDVLVHLEPFDHKDAVAEPPTCGISSAETPD